MEAAASPSQRGARAEAAVAAALVRSGARVYLPAFGSNGRIDLIYERDGTPVRVQCKTACRIGDALRFWTSSHTSGTPAPYDGQIDEFAAFAPSTGLVYVVPVTEAPGRACFLRLAPTRNGQGIGVRWASDFVLGPP